MRVHRFSIAAGTLEIQKNKRGPIGQILVELGYINEDDLQRLYRDAGAYW